MTRPTASQTVAIFILGTAISSGILAAPTLYPKSFDPTSTQPSDGLDPLSKGQLREFATAQHDGVVYANVVPRQNGDSLTPDDDSKYGKDGNDSNVSVSVNLEQRGNLSKRGGGGSKQDFVENENSPLLSDQRAEEQTTKELKKLRQKQREEEQKREELIEKLLKENGKNKLSLLRMETECEDSELQELRTRAITLWRQYKGFMEGELAKAGFFYHQLQSQWDEASKKPKGNDRKEARHEVFTANQEDLNWMYTFGDKARKVALIDEATKEFLKKLCALCLEVLKKGR
ncbi:hypothetical protein F5880DRAFT_1503127 [Lentinula raphanica]|nr:hypothetical protein EV360DRAFT_66136 [Lentinula raphanica]KAJ3828380.1 hypothetical protein F5880DRAFT_1503127 [Lentinula raphanica]